MGRACEAAGCELGAAARGEAVVALRVARRGEAPTVRHSPGEAGGDGSISPGSVAAAGAGGPVCSSLRSCCRPSSAACLRSTTALSCAYTLPSAACAAAIPSRSPTGLSQPPRAASMASACSPTRTASIGRPAAACSPHSVAAFSPDSACISAGGQKGGRERMASSAGRSSERARSNCPWLTARAAHWLASATSWRSEISARHSATTAALTARGVSHGMRGWTCFARFAATIESAAAACLRRSRSATCASSQWLVGAGAASAGDARSRPADGASM